MAVVTPSCYATHSHKHSGGDLVTPSHKSIKAQTKDVSGSDSDSRSDMGHVVSVNPVDASPVELAQQPLGAHTTTFCSHRVLLIGPSRKKSLIPKFSEKWCAAPLEIPY